MRNAQAMEAKNRALTESEARYRQLTEGCLDAVVVADGAGQDHPVQPRRRADLRLPRSDAVARAAVRPPHPGRLRRRRAPRPAPRSRPPTPMIVGKTVELVGRRKGGEEFPLELSLSAVEPGR